MSRKAIISLSRPLSGFLNHRLVSFIKPARVVLFFDGLFHAVLTRKDVIY